MPSQPSAVPENVKVCFHNLNKATHGCWQQPLASMCQFDPRIIVQATASSPGMRLTPRTRPRLPEDEISLEEKERGHPEPFKHHKKGPVAEWLPLCLRTTGPFSTHITTACHVTSPRQTTGRISERPYRRCCCCYDRSLHGASILLVDTDRCRHMFEFRITRVATHLGLSPRKLLLPQGSAPGC